MMTVFKVFVASVLDLFHFIPFPSSNLSQVVTFPLVYEVVLQIQELCNMKLKPLLKCEKQSALQHYSLQLSSTHYLISEA